MGITGSFSSGHVEALEVPPAEKQEPREKKSRCRHRLTDFGKCSNGAEECLLVLYEYAPLVSMPGHGPATVTPSVKKRTQGYIDFTPFDNGMAELLYSLMQILEFSSMETMYLASDVNDAATELFDFQEPALSHQDG
ncbi:hypothetical protein B296_00011512 [Ensete ventricosum]|uniref:Uncharacterized protein n=1 Tax=Ensete ventricosum TaxID=4639 RepID=A0A427B863_ENSVE|nr:hypothetical protein B296_00011512 [Ensete ventricosum]